MHSIPLTFPEEWSDTVLAGGGGGGGGGENMLLSGLMCGGQSVYS